MQSILSVNNDGVLHQEHLAIPDYAVTVREFKSGLAEIVVRLTNPIAELRRIRDLGIRGTGLLKTAEEIEAERERTAEENLRRAERRARQQVSFKVRSIGADHLLTLTYRDNVEDSEKLKSDFTRFIRLVREKYPRWEYVAVKEYQTKNFETTGRNSLHMHVACVGKQDLRHIRKCWYVAIGGSATDKGADVKGQVDLQYRTKRFGDNTPVYGAQELSNYLTKYISKTFEHDRELGQRRYSCSLKIEPPKVTRHYFGQFSAVMGDSFGAIGAIATELAYSMGLKDVGIWNLGTEIMIIRGAKA